MLQVLALAMWSGCDGARVEQTGAPLQAAAPVVLASGQAQPENLVVDDASLYWSVAGSAAMDGAIMTVPKSGGAPVLLASGQNVPFGIAVDDSSVYWANFAAGGQGEIMKVGKRGGTPVTLAGGLDAPRGVVVDAFNVYFLTTSAVMAVSKAGGVAIPIAATGCGNALIGDETSLYWVVNCVMFPPQGIAKVSKLGGVPVFLSTEAPGALAVDATSLYFGAGSTVYALDKFFGGLPLALSSQPGGAIAVDDRFVYFTTSPGIARVLKLGGATQTLTADPNAQGLALDPHSVYWLDFGIADGELLSLAKPD
jgi:hypothetical protein